MRKLFWLFYGCAVLALIWPGFYLVSPHLPNVMGLPGPFFWVIIWLLAMFIALAALYFSDQQDQP